MNLLDLSLESSIIGMTCRPIHPGWYTTMQMELPDKLYFKVGEVSELVGVPAYVLRFWETQFRKINPKRTPAGQRHYRKKDVELILDIKRLLYEEKFTIEGARKYLKVKSPGERAAPKAISIDEIRAELVAIRDMLART
jgi:DNA-binding transcriptional MerR regulator